MTDHNKQSQEVGSGRKPWPLCVSFKQLGRIRVYEEEEKEKAQIHMHGRKMIRKGGEKKKKSPNGCKWQGNNLSYIAQINCLQTCANVFFLVWSDVVLAERLKSDARSR